MSIVDSDRVLPEGETPTTELSDVQQQTVQQQNTHFHECLMRLVERSGGLIPEGVNRAMRLPARSGPEFAMQAFVLLEGDEDKRHLRALMQQTVDGVL